MMIGTNNASDYTAELIPENSIGIELGVWKGNTSQKFLPKCKHLYLVDSWSPVPYKQSTEWPSYEFYLKRYARITGSETETGFEEAYDEIYSDVCERFKDDPVTVFRMPTKDFFRSFNTKVDWIYVDADHSYGGVMYDLEHAFNLIKENGIIFGDDYHFSKRGVQKALNDFKRQNNYFFCNFRSNQWLMVESREKFDRLFTYETGPRGGLKKETVRLK
jgi:hypothetical protein